MYEYKFKNFNFQELTDFVYNLVDYYGLENIIFYPSEARYFDDIQLKHIAPGRNVEDKRGFAWAWKKYQQNVREVIFDQYSKDGTKKINVTINLDSKTIRLNSILGLSQLVIEDLIQKRFGGPQMISDLRLERTRARVTILEFFVAVFFSLTFTLLYAVIKVMNITLNWFILSYYVMLFFAVILVMIYIILPTAEIIKKFGLNIKKVMLELLSEVKRASRLNQLMAILSIIGLIVSIYSLNK